MKSFEDIFLLSKLPDPLAYDELAFLIIEAQNGNANAREMVTLHNIRLVINIVFTRFQKTSYDNKELVSVGIVGLLKAINAFDVNRGKPFFSFATKCIENEIAVFIRKGPKNEDSLEDIINVDKDGNTLKRNDISFSSCIDVAADYERKDIINVVNSVVEELTGRDKEIVKLYFGFYDDRQYSQNEIAIMMGMTRSNVSRIMKYSLEILTAKLRKCGILRRDFSSRSWVYNTQSKNGNDIDDVSSLNTIYGYFHNYSHQQIDTVLSQLSKDEKALLMLRYGDDLDNPLPDKKMYRSDIEDYYENVIPKIRKLLSKYDCKHINSKR